MTHVQGQASTPQARVLLRRERPEFGVVRNLRGSRAGETGEGHIEGEIIDRPRIAALGRKYLGTNQRGEIPDL